MLNKKSKNGFFAMKRPLDIRLVFYTPWHTAMYLWIQRLSKKVAGLQGPNAWRLFLQNMNSFVGTSGYQYPAWRGTFYPEKLANGKDVVVLRGSVPYHRSQLLVPPNPESQNHRKLVPVDTGRLPVWFESSAENYPLGKTQGLRG
jgi:hypothetical protein